MNNDYTLWPNTDGNLGNIKVQIPDGVNTFWPEGDALVGNFVYKDGKLVGFVDTKALIVNDSKSTTINYDYFDIELPFAENAMVFNREARNKYFNVKFNNKEPEGINGDYKFYNPTTILNDFTPLTFEEINSIQFYEYSSANHMFTGRLIDRPDKLDELHNICKGKPTYDGTIEVYDEPLYKCIPSDTCLGVIFGGNIQDDGEDGSYWDGAIEGEHYIHDSRKIDIVNGVADIEVENKVYHYESQYKKNGTLTMLNLSFKNENNPYFILIYADHGTTLKPHLG